MAQVIIRVEALLLIGLGAAAGVFAQNAPVLEWHRPAMLGPREGHALAYDPLRQRVVLYSGYSIGEYGTWEWDGTTWALRHTAQCPGHRTGYAMAWDPVRRRVLLVGGGDPTTGTFFNDTWDYDGRDWRLVSTSSGFQPRAFHAIATDWGRNRIVMFGGMALPSIALDETWEWDGIRWTLLQPRTIPDRRHGHGMAYCVRTGRLTMFGGNQYFGPYTTGTWEWDGTDWRDMAPAVHPSYRVSHGLVTSPVDGNVVLHGGSDIFGYLRDTWRWDGSRWTQLNTPTLPPERHSYPMAADVARRKVILLGVGQRPGSDGSDTWAFDGNDWRLAYKLEWPSYSGFVVHDSARDEFVALAERNDSNGRRMQTYTMDETHWRLKSPARVPPVRESCAIAFHAEARKVLLFGGYAPGIGGLDDTWMWDGAEWTEQTGTTRPPHSGGSPPTMTYDVERRKIVLFARTTGHTWEWDQSGWTRRSLVADPPPFDLAQVMYDSARGRIVLVGVYGSQFPFSHTWEFDGMTWRQMQPSSRPWIGRMSYLHRLGVLQLDPRTGDFWLWSGADWVKLNLPAPFITQWSTVAGLAQDAGRQRVRAIVSPSVGDVWFAWDLRFRQLTADNLYPRGGEPIRFGVELPALPGRPFVLGLAQTAYPGIPLRSVRGVGTELLPLTADALLSLSLQIPLTGTLDTNGSGTFVLNVPPDAALRGLGFHGAAVAFDGSGGIGAITHPVPIEIMR